MVFSRTSVVEIAILVGNGGVQIVSRGNISVAGSIEIVRHPDAFPQWISFNLSAILFFADAVSGQFDQLPRNARFSTTNLINALQFDVAGKESKPSFCYEPSFIDFFY